MSALVRLADISLTSRHVRLVPLGHTRNPTTPSETAFSIYSAEGHDPAQHLQQPARQTALD
jgi:hypothetical protein